MAATLLRFALISDTARNIASYWQTSQPLGSEVQPFGSTVQSGKSGKNTGQLTIAHCEKRSQDTSQAHELKQSTAPPQLLSPAQSTLHRPLPQLTSLQLPFPTQPAVSWPLPPVMFTQLLGPSQSALHAPLPQVTLVQLPLPTQPTVSGPLPPVTLVQLRNTPQVIVQSAASTQSMALRHVPPTVQSILQLNPAGQVIAFMHRPGFALQSTAQVLASRSHDVHCAGHGGGGGASIGIGASIGGGPSKVTPASTGWVLTHRPSTQTRPAAQLPVVSHAKSPLRWLTEQLPAAVTATTTSAAQSATSFTASLQS